ncbi:hypothetical protein [Streptomyces sp. N35]|uniref:hypothetical protein n=1 Tax=Streptomyces sp. N35 TaxID=2795730 RepID=UPI0018F74765|nr:hypothetical protein [Streptomyces sp. N35]
MAVRHQAERIGLALTTAAGPLTILADVLGLLDEVSPNGIQLVTLLILTSVTMFLLLEVRRFEILDSVDRRLAALDIDGTAARLRQERYGGVERVHQEFPVNHLRTLIREADTEVSVLQTFIPNLHLLQDDMQHALTRRGDARIRILLLFPKSPVANLRHEALRSVHSPTPPVDVKVAIEHNLESFARLSAALPEQARARLEVRVYNSLPSMAVYRADDSYLVSSFLHGMLAIDAPQTEIKGSDTARGAEVQEELNTLWQIGKPVGLADWQHSIELMDFDNVNVS